MALHATIRTLILTWSDVTNFLTRNDKSNDYPIRPERLNETDRFPALEIAQPNETIITDLEGETLASDSTVVVSVIDTDVVRANQIADALVLKQTKSTPGLHGFSGQVGNIFLDDICVDTIKRAYAANLDGSDTGQYVVSIFCTVRARF